MLAGPIDIAFDATIPPDEDSFGERLCRIEIKQGPQRMITLLPEDPAHWDCLVALLSQVEWLLMIFDGRFIPLCDMRFSGAAGAGLSTESDCVGVRVHAMKQRLSCYQTANWMLHNARLVDIGHAPMPELFATWLELLDELEIVNQIYLYVISDNGMPRDVSLAFVVEMAESIMTRVRLAEGLIDRADDRQRFVDCAEEGFEAPKEIASVSEFSGAFSAVCHPYACPTSIVDAVGDFKLEFSIPWLGRVYASCSWSALGGIGDNCIALRLSRIDFE